MLQSKTSAAVLLVNLFASLMPFVVNSAALIPAMGLLGASFALLTTENLQLLDPTSIFAWILCNFEIFFILGFLFVFLEERIQNFWKSNSFLIALFCVISLPIFLPAYDNIQEPEYSLVNGMCVAFLFIC